MRPDEFIGGKEHVESAAGLKETIVENSPNEEMEGDTSLHKDQIGLEHHPKDQLDSKTATVKFEKVRSSTGEHTGRPSSSKLIEDSASKEPGRSVRMNESDIRIVTMAPKDKSIERDQKNTSDLLVIQSQLDQNMLTLKVTRDP